MFSGARAEWWQGTEIPVSDIWGLHRVLEDLRSKPDYCIIRGAPLEGVDINRAHKRRTKHSRKDQTPPAYADVGRRWMGIDIDNLPYDPERFDPYGDPEEFFEWLCKTISEDLEDVTVVYQFSTGAGVVEEGKKHNIVKVHLWFWLDRAYTCNEIKRWAQGVNLTFEASLPAKPGEKVVQLIDTSPLQPVGILYTADPVIEKGVSTAVVRRVGIVDLGEEEATLKIPEGRRGSIAINSPLRTGRPVNAGLDLEDRIAMIGDGPGMMGFHPGFVAVVGYYFWKHGADADPKYIFDRIVAQALSREDDRPPGEVRQRLERLEDIIDSVQGSQAFKEETGAYAARSTDEEGPRESDLSQPYYPYPDIPNPIAGTEEQKRVIGAWFAEAVKRAAARRIELDTGEPAEIEIDPEVPARLQITGPVGSGKTSTVERIIKDSADALLAQQDEDGELAVNIYFAAGLTDKAAETADAIPGAIVLRGVGADDPDLEGKQMCWRSDMASQVQASQGILSSICKSCPFRFECGYRKQAEKVRELEDKPGVRVFTGPHEFLHYPSQVKGGWDIVIVDERYKAEGSKSSKPTKTLAYPFDFSGFVYVPKGEDPDPDKLVDEEGRLKVDIDPRFVREASKAILKAIKGNEGAVLAAIRDLPVPGFLDRINATTLSRTARFLHRAFEATKPFDGKGVPRFNPRASDEEIIELIESETDSRLSFVARVFEALASEYDAPRDQANTIRVEGKRIVLRGFSRPTKVAPAVPVLLLDATAKLSLNRKIWGEDVADTNINIENKVSAFQIIRQSWTKASFLDEGKGTWKLDEVAKVINRYPNSFVAAPKAVREAIEPKLGDTILTGHYANLRGLNAFSACKTGFVLCDPMVPPVAVLDLALAYGAADETAYETPAYIDEVRRYRMRDPNDVQTAICKVADNPMMEMYREILVDDEMLQAIGRVRGFWNERTVYILSNRPYDQTIDGVISWEEFVGGPTGANALAEASPQFVVDSPSWVVDQHPAITRTRAVATGLLAQLRDAGWKPCGWKAFKDKRNVFDVLAPEGQGSLVGPGSTELGDGWQFETDQEAAVDFVGLYQEDLMARGFMTENPDWIIREFGNRYGSRGTIKRELKRIKVQLASCNIYILSPQLHLETFNNSMNSTVEGGRSLNTPPKPVFGKFRYRTEGARRWSFGWWFGRNFGSVEGKIGRGIEGLKVVEEVAFDYDADMEANDAIARAQQIARTQGVTAERQLEVEAPARVLVEAAGRESISFEEAIRRKAERDADREANRERDDYEAEMIEDAITDEIEAAAKEAVVPAGGFDLTTAFRS
jgi:hypothetical protein